MGRKPQGPLVIAISLDRQTLKLYDANGVFAESRVSTGMRGHGTPMGVFSVIQKQKWHRSNIYSGAPMPYMQRITWSGIALHAGVVPNYPASHGCIRMPASFATRMYGWTRIGARVIITPGDISPTRIAHALLPTEKPKPTTTASLAPQPNPSATNAGKGVTVGINPGATISRDPVRTADASGTVPHLGTGAAAPTTDRDIGQAPVPEKLELRTALDESTDTGTSPGTAADKAVPAAAKPAEAQSANAPIASDASIGKSQASTAAANSGDSAPAPDGKAGASAMGVAKDGSTADPTETSPVKSGGKAVIAGTKIDGAAKDSSPAVSSDKPDIPPSDPAVKPVPKRTGRIAVFISGKDSKIYVRQNFAPLFDAPVTIAASDRPLGTHIFTAEADTVDKDHFHWSVISLPAMSRRAGRQQDHHRHGKPAADVAPASTPQADTASEALDRITIPESVMSEIAGSLSSGGSIIVSDLGVTAGGETGEGTDFIVPLR
ncbi:MAG TPA: L,D-transpeptidase family protein [Nitrobacter sp.]|nr:L,D-transpeptidase family protein [Nitrobacter sp.]